MSSIRELVTTIEQTNYLTVVVLTIVGYDYVLTFSQEVEYVWNKPWTLVSTLYIPIRYSGICSAIFFALVGSSFTPNNEKMYVILLYLIPSLAINRQFDPYSCKAVVNLSTWTLFLFFVVADLLMILRVWAMYSRSRLIIIPLVLYAADVILFLISCVMVSTNNSISMTVQILNFTTCMAQFDSSIWNDAVDPIQVTLGVLMFILATGRFIWQSVQMYKVTRQFQLGRYMNHLVKESMFYFLVMLSCALICILYYEGRISPFSLQAMLFTRLVTTMMFVMLPRFVLGLREIHARDIQRRRGSDIYPISGLISLPGIVASSATVAFTDPERDGELEAADGMVTTEQDAGS